MTDPQFQPLTGIRAHLLHEALPGGDLRMLSLHEVRLVYNDFETLSAGLTAQQRLSLVEQFLLFEAISNEELTQLMRSFPPEEQVAIARFIAEQIPRSGYTEFFQDSWHLLSDRTQHKLIIQCLHQDPTLAPLVAPFVSLNHTITAEQISCFPEPRNFSGRLHREKDRHLITCLAPDAESARILFLRCLRQDDTEGIHSLVAHFTSYQPGFLMPWLPALIERNIITREDAQKILTFQNQASSSFGQIHFYFTSEEWSQFKKLREQVLEIVSHRNFRVNHWKNDPSIQSWPENLREKGERLSDSARIRAASHLTSGYREMTAILDDRQDRLTFLENVLINDIPVLLFPERISLTRPLMKKLIHSASIEEGDLLKQSDLAEVKTLAEAGYIREVLEVMLLDLGRGKDSLLLRQLKTNLAPVMDALPAAARKVLAQAITLSQPAIWVESATNLSLPECPSAHSLATRLSGTPQDFAESYTKFYWTLRTLNRSHPGQFMEAAVLREVAIHLATETPTLLIEDAFSAALFSPAVRTQKLSDALQDPHKRNELLEELIPSLTVNKSLCALIPQVRELLLKDSSLFDSLIPTYAITHVDSLLTPQELRERLPSVLTHSNWETVRYQSWVAGSMLENPRIVGDVLARLAGTPEDHSQRLKLFARLLNNVDFVLKPGSTSGDRGDQAARIEAICDLMMVESCGSAEARDVLLDPDFLKLMGRRSLGQVQQHLPAYADIFPEKIPFLAKHLPAEVMIPIYERQIHSLAAFTSPDIRSEVAALKLPKALRSQMESMNPFHEINSDTVSLRTLHQKIDQSPFGWLHRADRLRAVQTEERFREQGISMPDRLADSKILQQFEQTILLNTSPLACMFAEEIQVATPRLQTSLTSLLALARRHNITLEALPEHSCRLLESRLQQAVQPFFIALFQLSGDEQVDCTRFSSRLLSALAVYHRSVAHDSGELSAVLKTVIDRTSRGTLENWRLWNDQADSAEGRENAFAHMKSVGFIPTSLTIQQYSEFHTPSSRSVTQDLTVSAHDAEQFIRLTLSQAVADNHLSAEELKHSLTDCMAQYRKILEPLKELTEKRKALQRASKQKDLPDDVREAVQSSFVEINTQIHDYRELTAAAVREVRARMFLMTLRTAPADLLIKPRIQIDSWQILPDQLFQELRTFYGKQAPEFERNLSIIEATLKKVRDLQSQRSPHLSALTLTDSYSLEEHFLIGAEPVESCQHYDSVQKLNYSLLSYCTDPSVVIVKMHDESGKLCARAVLRLATEVSRNMPALFLERTYTSTPHPSLNQEIVRFAADKAHQLGIPLYTHSSEGQVDDATAYPEVATLAGTLSRTGYTYSDAGGGLIHRKQPRLKNVFRIA